MSLFNRCLSLFVVIVMVISVMPVSIFANSNYEHDHMAKTHTAKADYLGHSSVSGDINTDKSINAIDAVLLAQFLAKWDVVIDKKAADCNGDGTINAVDAVLLAQYLAKWDVVLGCSHKPETAVKENEVSGTCEVKGSYDEVVYCAVCEEELSRTTITTDFGDHTYQNGSCIHCGESNITVPTIIIQEISANADDSIDVNVEIKNNPGIFGAILTFAYDSKLTLTAATAGSAFGELVMTKPGVFKSPCNFVWDGQDAPAENDGIILTLTFTVSQDVDSGEVLEISCSYMNGDIVDANFESIDLDLMNGAINVSTEGAHTHTPSASVKENEVSGTCKTPYTYDEVVYCSECGNEMSRTQKTGDLGDHKYTDGVCIHCGEAEPTSEPSIVVNSASAKAGETITITIDIKHNPGIFGAILSVAYDSKLTLVSATSGSAFGELVMTKPGAFVSPCNFVWDGMDAPAESNGTILALTFTVSENVSVGDELTIDCFYINGDIVDENFKSIDLKIINGVVAVK